MGHLQCLTVVTHGSILHGMNLITQAIEASPMGIKAIGDALGVTYQAVRKWEAAGRLPRTELTGETDYATAISDICGGAVSAADLIEQTRLGWLARSGRAA